jgi:hypothetical protein
MRGRRPADGVAPAAGRTSHRSPAPPRPPASHPIAQTHRPGRMHHESETGCRCRAGTAPTSAGTARDRPVIWWRTPAAGRANPATPRGDP